MNYLDFDLEIGQGSGRDYPVVARSQAAGEARATLRFPYDELQLESRLKDLRIALLLTGLKHRRVLSREEQVVQDFGRDLFNALMVGKIGERYRVALNEAAGQGAGLRLRLRLLAAELAALPWEYLYDPDLGEYVCLSGETPIVRYVELPRVIPPLALEPPLRILGMIASPSDQEDPLDVETEKQRVAEAVKPLSKKGLVSLAWLDGQTWRDLQRKLREGPWHVFHFIGHGGYHRPTEEGVIILADEQGRSHPFTATQLGRLLAGHKSLRLALLNACEGARGSERDIFSSTAATLVQHGLPAVLAMQYPITDRTAIELARAFYEAVADGFPVDAAVVEARRAITFARHNTVEWGTPVLYMRSPDGVLFKSPPPAPSPSPGEGRGE
ncbi:MAG: CHAT domain-containing protein, partial [Chloroflexota bacterium]